MRLPGSAARGQGAGALPLLLLLLLLAAVALLPVLEAVTCRGDGCTIPFHMPLPYRHLFRSLCNKLDTCYQCGAGRGLSRRACDEQFLGDTQRACSWFDVSCRRYSLVHFAAVRLAAQDFWMDHSPPWCRELWVPDCLPGPSQA